MKFLKRLAFTSENFWAGLGMLVFLVLFSVYILVSGTLERAIDHNLAGLTSPIKQSERVGHE